MPAATRIKEHEKSKIRKLVLLWLSTGCLLVFSMTLVGGITRLTHSGLSITTWKLVKGMVPPMSQSAWEEAFADYKTSPEYQKVNYNFTLSEYKSIYWWEYIHRLLGRLIGLVFIVPFLWLSIGKKITKKAVRRLLPILGLGILQGFMGWYMVASGLVDNPHVSHYRLAMHLLLALLIYSYILWLIFEIRSPRQKFWRSGQRNFRRMAFIFLILIVLQIAWGAFAAGLKAGHFYNTFPLMGKQWIAPTIADAFQRDGLASFVDFPVSVQFVHRWLGTLLLALGPALWYFGKKEGLHPMQKRGLKMLLAALGLQFILGISTLLLNVPVVLGVLHQAGAVILLSCILFVIHQSRRDLVYEPENLLSA